MPICAKRPGSKSWEMDHVPSPFDDSANPRTIFRTFPGLIHLGHFRSSPQTNPHFPVRQQLSDQLENSDGPVLRLASQSTNLLKSSFPIWALISLSNAMSVLSTTSYCCSGPKHRPDLR